MTALAAATDELTAPVRVEAARLLNRRLADALDLHAQCRQAHWNVKEPSSIALHKLFGEIGEDVGRYADLLAERVVELGEVAEGTAAIVAGRSSLPEYPLDRSSGAEHLAAVSEALADFLNAVRLGIDELGVLQDAAGARLLTEIAGGAGQWLSFVVSRQQPEA